MQINTITAAIAGDGTAYTPHLLKRYTSVKTGKDIFVYKKQPLISLPLSKTKIHLIKRALRRVITDGTGRKGAHSTLIIAGKTGTAQNVQGDPHSWFTCYAPANGNIEDMIAVTVITEHAGHGSEFSAPFATAILEGIFHHKDPLVVYRKIMQKWPSKGNIYQQWLQNVTSND